MDFGLSGPEQAFATRCGRFPGQPPETFLEDGTDAGYARGPLARLHPRARRARWLSMGWPREHAPGAAESYCSSAGGAGRGRRALRPLSGCLQVSDSISATARRPCSGRSSAVARGEASFGRATASPGAGSDLLALTTRARLDGITGCSTAARSGRARRPSRVRHRAGPHDPIHPPPWPHHVDGGQPAARDGRAPDPQPDGPRLPLRDLHGRRAGTARLGAGQAGRGLQPAPERARHRSLLGALLQGAVPPPDPGAARRIREHRPAGGCGGAAAARHAATKSRPSTRSAPRGLAHRTRPAGHR